MPKDDDLKPLEPPPGSTPFDYGLTAAKVGAIAFPFLGSGVTFFDLVTAPIRGKRFSEWCEELRRRLNSLSEKVQGLTPEKLAASEEFVSAFNQAAQAVMRTHDQDKFEALQNAVLNVAMGAALNEDVKDMFLNLIDRFTPLYLRLLTQFSLKQLVRIVDAPDWLKQDICAQTAKDLLDQGLLGPLNNLLIPDRNQLIVGEKGFYTFRAGLTPLGEQFLSFIREPKEAKNDGR